jgi:dihydrofolate synthase/folylpolyglutamate synthase
MRFDSLAAWLHWLETLHPSEIDLGLERIGVVAKKMRLTKPAKHVITVAGTNGKGSTVTFLTTILKEAGLNVGAYTSPHLLVYNERVVINGKQVSDKQLCEAFEQVESARGDVSLTYFEFGTLAAFALFEKANLDVAVLEVGLGGRLDAVNLVDADVAVMTTISLDHEAWLGNTREAIGIEKAGIFRKNKPAVCGDIDLPISVVKEARHKAAVLIRRNIDFMVAESTQEWAWQGVDEDGQVITLEQLPLPQLPIDNAATAIQALMCLPFAIPHQAIETGLKNATLMGRYQKIEKEVTHILDVAHNPESALYLAKKLKQDVVEGKTIAVFAMLADKDCTKVVEALKAQVDDWYVAGIDVARGQTASQLQAILKAVNINQVQSFDTIAQAYEAAKKTAGKQDRILVCGSFYTVSAVLAYLDVH